MGDRMDFSGDNMDASGLNPSVADPSAGTVDPTELTDGVVDRRPASCVLGC
ncbi:hypothetical protein OAN61_01090 [bacterium]|nr:hypothetical protein [bacterium]